LDQNFDLGAHFGAMGAQKLAKFSEFLLLVVWVSNFMVVFLLAIESQP